MADKKNMSSEELEQQADAILAAADAAEAPEAPEGGAGCQARQKALPEEARRPEEGEAPERPPPS